MTVSIELLLDARTEALVRAEWQLLERAGHSSMGAYRAPSNRPHITLLARPAMGDIDVSWADALLPLAIGLGAPTTFGDGDRVVLVRPVVRDPALARLHRQIHEAAGADPPAAIVGTAGYSPPSAAGEWMPHVTLARRLRRESLGAALALIGPAVTGAAVALRRWDSDTRTVTILADGRTASRHNG